MDVIGQTDDADSLGVFHFRSGVYLFLEVLGELQSLLLKLKAVGGSEVTYITNVI